MTNSWISQHEEETGTTSSLPDNRHHECAEVKTTAYKCSCGVTWSSSLSIVPHSGCQFGTSTESANIQRWQCVDQQGAETSRYILSQQRNRRTDQTPILSENCTATFIRRSLIRDTLDKSGWRKRYKSQVKHPKHYKILRIFNTKLFSRQNMVFYDWENM